MHAPHLARPETRLALAERKPPYWNILEYCRHLGFEKRPGQPARWFARIRKKDGRYKQNCLGGDRNLGDGVLDYDSALRRARAWFALPDIAAIASDPYNVGTTQALRYERSDGTFTVGDALIDYVEWKRLAATRKTFEALLSLINFHIIPRLGRVPIDSLTPQVLTTFYREVLETPPKRGNQPLGARVTVAELDADALRRRKKTVNTLVGILRLAVRMAWENGHCESERTWHCIRRLPSRDVPRQIFLTRRQCNDLVKACRPDLAKLVLGALYTGCRVSELSELRKRDVARDVFGIYVSASKGGRSRHVYLPEEGMQFFLTCCQRLADDDRVFTTASGKSWDGRHKHRFRDAVREAGLPEGFVFHGLRHTYASQLVQAGASISMVARQLGHANTDTVSRTYGHLSSSSIESELQMRFAPLAPSNAQHSIDAHAIRRSLQDRALSPPKRSWPHSNFNTFDGELLKEIKAK